MVGLQEPSFGKAAALMIVPALLERIIACIGTCRNPPVIAGLR